MKQRKERKEWRMYLALYRECTNQHAGQDEGRYGDGGEVLHGWEVGYWGAPKGLGQLYMTRPSWPEIRCE